LDAKRNLVHQFQDQYQAIEHPLDEGRLEDAKQVLRDWKVAHPGLQGDNDACMEAIELMEQLGLNGRIYYIDETPVGFIIGESLNREMFAMHFSKANVHYKGIYQYLYQAFVQTLPDTVSWVNWAQDLGDLGLRQSKSSYAPDKMLSKMRIFLK
jgi:hypothetical protein